jgi:hypothetical protein
MGKVAVGEIQGNWNPLFAEAEGDLEVISLIHAPLLTVDRQGEVLYQSTEGQTSSYGGAEYTYKGIADIASSYVAETDLSTYTISLKDGVKFSDGKEMTADDVIFTYYLLADWNKITAQVENLFPRPYVKTINKRLKQIDTLLSAFVRGQAMVCLFLALFYGIGLTLIGVDLGFAVGFLAGVFSFVPYMGTMTGFVLSLLLALTQGASWPLFALIVAVFLIGQFIEGYILTPKLVGDKVGLHPAWIIFALFAGGALFGFTGVLLAVPLFTILKVVGQVVIEAYQKTAFYKGKV